MCRGFDKRVQYGLQIECRAADDLKHVSGGSLLLERLAQLVQQPRVLDGDDGLSSEVLHQLHLLIGEWSNLRSIDGNNADDLIRLEYRNAKISSDAADIDRIHQQWMPIEVGPIGPAVVNVEWLPRTGNAVHRGVNVPLRYHP